MNICTTQHPESLTCSFELHEKLIVVKAKLNGIDRNFLLDSGAPDIILNKKHIEVNKLINSDITFQSSTGSGYIALTFMKNFNWNSLTIKNKRTAVMDFEHLEKALNITVYGILGYSVFRDYTLFVDYKNKQVNLWSDINKSNYKVISHIDFIMQKHIVVVETKVGNLNLKMGLDTGATANVVDIKYQKKLNKHLKKLDKDTIYGGSKSTKEIISYSLDEMIINNYTYKNMRLIFNNINHLNASSLYKKDGSLGYQFLKVRQVAINYPKNQLQFIRKKPAVK